MHRIIKARFAPNGVARKIARAGVVAALASVAAAPLLAQDTMLQTFGAATESDPSASQEAGFQDAYVPISPGALPDDPEQEAETADTPETATQRPASRATAVSGEAPAGPASLAARAGEDPETTGSLTAVRSRGAIDTEALRNAVQTSGRVPAIDARPRTFEETPYSPIGLRAGNFDIFPSIEQGLTYTSNANSGDNGPALLSETTLRLAAQSDWSRHQATLDGFGTFRKTLSGEEVDDIEAGLVSALRLDLSEMTRVNAGAAYAVSPEGATAPATLVDGTLSDPTRQVFEASLGLEQDIGALRLAGTTRVERELYGDADLSTGGTISQADRDATLYSFALRTGYEMSATLTPFFEAEIGRRVYDEDADSAGYERSALRTGLHAGVELDITEKLVGELSAGWINENFEDDRLDSLSGASVQADLNWSPQRGTDINLNAGTTVEGSTAPGQEGSLLYSAAITATRELRANLTGTALVGLAYRDYAGLDERDLIFNSEVGLTYWLNRNTGLTGRGRYERLASTFEGRDSDAASVFVGLRLQR